MGYADYLKQMLRPLGVYRLDRGYNKAELDAIGDALDKVSAQLEMQLGCLDYAALGGEYLEKLESLLPIVNFADTEEERREKQIPVVPRGTASNEMCTFLILNISSLQLIPVNVIAYRSQYGSVNPTEIVGPALLATLGSTLAGFLFCGIMNQREKRRRAGH